MLKTIKLRINYSINQVKMETQEFIKISSQIQKESDILTSISSNLEDLVNQFELAEQV